jgi:hypothetical protein
LFWGGFRDWNGENVGEVEGKGEEKRDGVELHVEC